MPVNVALMLKYSDVLGDGSRSPRNYFEQLARCSGFKPINILATINNLWVAGQPEELSWTSEFLSDSIRNKVTRLRKQLGGPTYVFTRAGALLNLKLLLGLEPAAVPFEATAIGAISLHANDYLESDDTGRLSVGTLPVIAEFAPVWELQNIRLPRALLLRSYYLLGLVRSDDQMRELFAHVSGGLMFAGLPYEDYFSLLFGIYTNTMSSIVARPYPTSIINAAEIAEKASLSRESFEAFIASKAFRRSAAHDQSLTEYDGFLGRIKSKWRSDFLSFRQRPLLAMPKGDFLVLDLQFLFENASAGLFWSLADVISLDRKDSRRQLFFRRWGELFEVYVQDLLGYYFPEQKPVVHPGPPQLDGLLTAGDDALVFEVKAGYLPDKAKGSRDEKVLAAALHKKYVCDENGREVGVKQLAARAKALLAGKISGVSPPSKVYPILIGEDPILQTVGLNRYLDEIFRKEVTDARIMPLVVMLIDELEQVLPHIRAGDLAWRDLFAHRTADGHATAEPVHTTFADLAALRNIPIRSDTFLAAQSETLIEMIKHSYRGLLSDVE